MPEEPKVEMAGNVTSGDAMGAVPMRLISSDCTTAFVMLSFVFRKRLADHARLEVPRHQSVDILRGPSVGHAN